MSLCFILLNYFHRSVQFLNCNKNRETNVTFTRTLHAVLCNYKSQSHESLTDYMTKSVMNEISVCHNRINLETRFSFS